MIHGCTAQADLFGKNGFMHFLPMYFFLQNNFWPAPWCYDAESLRGERETIEHLSSAGGESMQEIDGIGYSNTYIPYHNGFKNLIRTHLFFNTQ